MENENENEHEHENDNDNDNGYGSESRVAKYSLLPFGINHQPSTEALHPSFGLTTWA